MEKMWKYDILIAGIALFTALGLLALNGRSVAQQKQINNLVEILETNEVKLK